MKKILAIVLQLLGVALLIGFAALVWWKSALLVAAAACLAAAWTITQDEAAE